MVVNHLNIYFPVLCNRNQVEWRAACSGRTFSAFNSVRLSRWRGVHSTPEAVRLVGLQNSENVHVLACFLLIEAVGEEEEEEQGSFLFFNIEVCAESDKLAVLHEVER